MVQNDESTILEQEIVEQEQEILQKQLNPWLMANIAIMEIQTMTTPTGWLEWDND